MCADRASAIHALARTALPLLILPTHKSKKHQLVTTGIKPGSAMSQPDTSNGWGKMCCMQPAPAMANAAVCTRLCSQTKGEQADLPVRSDNNFLQQLHLTLLLLTLTLLLLTGCTLHPLLSFQHSQGCCCAVQMNRHRPWCIEKKRKRKILR